MVFPTTLNSADSNTFHPATTVNNNLASSPPILPPDVKDSSSFLTCPAEGCGAVMEAQQWAEHQDFHLAQALQHVENEEQSGSLGKATIKSQRSIEVELNGSSKNNSGGFFKSVFGLFGMRPTTPPPSFCDTGVDFIIPQLHQALLNVGSTARLCHPATLHIVCQENEDRGWGCGYRNIQMLLHSLQAMLPSSRCERIGLTDSIPSIPWIQRRIEAGWRAGFDALGAKQFKGQLRGSRAWIGAAQVYVLLAQLGIKSTLYDFHRPTGPDGTHPALMEWAFQWFNCPFKAKRRSLSTSSAHSFTTAESEAVVTTDCPPVFLQHRGHSVLLVGVEISNTGEKYLLVFDPNPPDAKKRASSSFSIMREGDSDILVAEEEERPGVLVKRHRLSEWDLSKKSEYEAVAVELEGAPSCSKVLMGVRIPSV